MAVKNRLLYAGEMEKKEQFRVIKPSLKKYVRWCEEEELSAFMSAYLPGCASPRRVNSGYDKGRYDLYVPIGLIPGTSFEGASDIILDRAAIDLINPVIEAVMSKWPSYHLHEFTSTGVSVQFWFTPDMRQGYIREYEEAFPAIKNPIIG